LWDDENLMKFGSLFSGIGGIDLGLERAGMQCIWQVEWDLFCQKVLAKHWPDVPRYGDIHDTGRHNLETPDLISGGFPCQPISLAGKREAQTDERWLWPEFARVVDELRPRYVLVENVPGLYTAGGSEVLADLATLGYDAEWHSIPATAVGAPHIRYRFFLVAYTSSPGRQQISGSTYENEGQHAGGSPEETDQLTGNGQRNRPGIMANTPGVFGKEFSWDEPGRFLSYNEPPEIQHYQRRENSPTNWWEFEPNVGRVAHGVPSRVDRLRGLGNAVVPQLAEWIGRRILDYDREVEAQRT
jgi:DNA (cytosine-5)-methyltransferase 1